MKNTEINKDIPEGLSLLKEIKKSSGECLHHIRALTTKVRENPKSSHGMSFLDVKNQLMGSYMANLALLVDKKTSGQSVREDPSIDRLVEIRTVLEKMRPIEHKLKYQINKVVTAYKEKKQDPSDPRKFRANFGAFANASESDSSDDEEKGSEDKPKTYVAPKLAPVHYSDDETPEDRLKKQTEKKTKKALSSAMLREMREQYTDAPIEITESRDLHRIRDNRKMKERTEYEETNFMRLPVSKKESAGMRKLGTMSALGALADFGDMEDSGQGGPAKKRKKVHKVQFLLMMSDFITSVTYFLI
ncbi:neuroguidin-like [Plakobranchus ocellatus]|uniref:Neuroguidin-like n=1 Tax=Plakobranchus ocellatus TaxID=259542 RepID=A0AAV3ZL41_9GAST|nr:neuroguidin-like [Plakobranchus ocellatus]